jgi:2-C-methyl-D-erythritol 2,4-cyclodiphosphate synthase
MKIGIGYDVHRLVENRLLILGGVEIPFDRGLLGHSDADVLIHAIMDALLGAAGMGDIGQHFPDTDGQYEGVSSIELLKRVDEKLKLSGFYVVNIDSIIIAQRPKIAPYIENMKYNISNVLGVELSDISIKATTTEGLGFVGTEKGIAAQAVVLLNKNCMD